MATFTVRPEGIIRQPALTMPGNATGSEAACTSLTASQIRTLLSLGTTSDVTFDIVRATTSVLTPLLNNTNAAALIIGNSTYGVTVPGAAVVSGDISMSKTSAQGYLNLYSPDGTKLLYLFANNGGTGVMAATTNIQMSSASGSMSVTSNQIALSPTSGNAYVYVGGTNSTFDVYDSSGGKYSRLTHDGTNGILSTSSGNLNLVPTGGTVAVTGGITASGNVSYAQGLSTGTVTKSANYTTTADDYRVNVTTNSIDITFETAVGCANREHEVINSGSGVVTLKTTSAQTISGSASGALTLAQWKSIRVVSDGANWLIMSQIT